MNRRILIIVLCALVLSLCASYLVYRAVGSRMAPGKVAPAVNLVAAGRDLPAGTLIHAADLKVIQWSGAVPKGSSLKSDPLLNRGVLSSIYEGEPVTEARLSPVGSGGGLAATIPPGMRATAVKVNEVVGVAGFVVPGMRVDVLITGLPPGGNAGDGPRVRTLLQNIQVLSAGTNFQKDQEGKPEQAQVVNLLVTPTQAEILSLANNETRIQLILRNPMDTQLSQLPGTDMVNLFGGAPRVQPQPQPPPQPERAQGAPRTERVPVPKVIERVIPGPYVVEISNGSVHTKATFARPESEP